MILREYLVMFWICFVVIVVVIWNIWRSLHACWASQMAFYTNDRDNFHLTCNLTCMNENRVSLLWSIECYLCINLECLLSLFKSSFLDSSWTTALCLDRQLPCMARKIENVSVWHTLLLAQRRNKPSCPSSRFERFSCLLSIYNIRGSSENEGKKPQDIYHEARIHNNKF